MNKIMNTIKKLAAVMLIAAMALAAFTACANKGNKPEELILGKWVTDFDIGAMFKAAFAEDGLDVSALDLKGVAVPYTFEFGKDSKYSCSVEESEVKSALKKVFTEQREGLAAVLKTVPDMGDLSDELIEMFIGVMEESMDAAEIAKGLRSEGSYKLEDGKLTLEGFELSSKEALKIEVDGKKLVLSLAEDSKAEAIAKKLFPLEFRKTN